MKLYWGPGTRIRLRGHITEIVQIHIGPSTEWPDQCPFVWVWPPPQGSNWAYLTDLEAV
jgi:hypothetical protein